MTHSAPLQDDLKLAAAVSREASETREELRWKARPDDPERVEAISRVLGSIDATMSRLRSHIGRERWHPLPSGPSRQLRLASKSLQYQRRQLKKMVR